MKKVMKDVLNEQDQSYKVNILAQAAKIVRMEALAEKHAPFIGTFESKCQESYIPTALKTIVSMVVGSRIEDQLAAAICQPYRLDGDVAPPPLQKGRFTMVATDNIDHNSSSNTAMTSMHWTSLSAIQVRPTDPNQPKRGKILIPIVASDCKLPDAYVVVPWIDIQTTNIKVPWQPKIFDTRKNGVAKKGYLFASKAIKIFLAPIFADAIASTKEEQTNA